MKKLILAFLALSFIACEEEPDRIPTKVYGTLHIADTDIPIPNAKISLSSLLYYRDYIIDSTQSDANGNYHFDFSVSEGNLDARLVLICEAPNFYGTRFFDYSHYSGRGQFPAGGLNEYNPSLVPFAWLQIDLNFSTPYRFYLKAPLNPDGNISVPNATQGTYYIQVKGNSWNKIEYEIQVDGRWHQFEDSIFAGILDTTLYQISY